MLDLRSTTVMLRLILVGGLRELLVCRNHPDSGSPYYTFLI